MPVLDGLEATRRLVELGTTARILILTTFDLDEYVYAAIRAGASGFLLKDVRPSQLVDAIGVVADGEALLAPAVTRRLLERFAATLPTPEERAPALATLTDREREVLELVASGTLELRDRRATLPRRDDGEDARLEPAQEARTARPRAGGRARVRGGPRAPGS